MIKSISTDNSVRFQMKTFRDGVNQSDNHYITKDKTEVNTGICEENKTIRSKLIFNQLPTKPNKVKHFQEKERAVLMQNLSEHNKYIQSQGESRNSYFDDSAKNHFSWMASNPENDRTRNENHSDSLPVDNIWSPDHLNHFRSTLASAPSSLKKKNSVSSSTKKQKGKRAKLFTLLIYLLFNQIYKILLSKTFTKFVLQHSRKLLSEHLWLITKKISSYIKYS